MDVVRKTIQAQGVQGMFKGLGASFMYRSSFVAMFGGTSLIPSSLHVGAPGLDAAVCVHGAICEGSGNGSQSSLMANLPMLRLYDS